MEKFLNLEFLQNLVAFVAPFGTLVLVEIARQSKNKIVSREGPMVISKMYDQYSDLQGSERKTKAREYFKNLFLEYLPTLINSKSVLILDLSLNAIKAKSLSPLIFSHSVSVKESLNFFAPALLLNSDILSVIVFFEDLKSFKYLILKLKKTSFFH